LLKASGDSFLLPFRNLAKIYCDASGRNGLYTDNGEYKIKVSVSLWESKCMTLADDMEKLRKKRVEKILASLKEYSNCATSYQNNYDLNKKESSKALNFDDEIKKLETKIKDQQAKIDQLNNITPDLDLDIKNTDIKVQESTKKISQIKAQIDSALQQMESIKNSIDVLEASKNDSTKNKATFEALYKQNLQNFMKGLNVIKNESPLEAQLVKDIEQCPTKSSVTECSIGKILPL